MTSFNQSYVPEEEIIQPIDPPTPSEEDPVEETFEEGSAEEEDTDEGGGDPTLDIG